MGIDLVGGWSQLIGLVPAGVLTLATIAGVILIIVRVGGWAWKRARSGGSGMGGFPWWSLIIGGVLAGPQLFIPAILILFQAFAVIIVRLIEFVGSVIG